MASTTTAANNKVVKFLTSVTREYVRGNLFSPYMSASPNAIIRVYSQLKSGGEQMNIPLMGRASGPGVGTGTLTGNEEALNNYGFRLWIDWARNAVKTNKAEIQKASFDIFGQARPILSDWGRELQRDEIILALGSIPTPSTVPTGLGSFYGQRVNGVPFSLASTAQKNTWMDANSDRVLFGNAVANYTAGNFASSLANVDSTNDRLTAASLLLLKRLARRANPRIRPFMTEGDGAREYYVLFCGSNIFRDIAADATIVAANTNARAREGNGMSKNPLFQDGDLLYRGIIIREIPEIDMPGATSNLTFTGAGASSIDVAPVFLCGQSAVAFGWGQAPRATRLDDTDYDFLRGVGIEMAYGVGKLAKDRVASPTNTNVGPADFGVATGFFASIADA